MKNIFLFILISITFTGCKKYLDKSPDKQLVIPSKISDLQALMDDNNKMNSFQAGSGDASSDDYYLTYSDWSTLSTQGNRNQYIWGPELYFESRSNEWSNTYNVVYSCNIVLEECQKFDPSNETAIWNNTVGMAYFFRGYSFWKALQLWSKAYDGSTAENDLGIPLRLNSNFNERSVRSSVKDSYDQAISDAKASVRFLPKYAVHPYRPSQAAAYGLLARIFLSMRDYEKANLYADSSLQIFSALLNYNDLSSAATYPIPRFNKETILHLIMPFPSPLNPSRAKIDTVLIRSYAADDLRKDLFFRLNPDGSYAYRGTYEQGNFFTGIVTDEMYLVRAECRARKNDIAGAMSDLNTVLVTRWRINKFVPFTANTAQQALDIVLSERRKELIFRDLRWTDIKRLNKEGRNINLRRVLNNVIYDLPANDPRFALPLPALVIDFTGMPQNPR